MLPNLLIIGAGKAGTTSLHSYLSWHPEVSMSKMKETKFFTSPRWSERVGWYEQQFPEDLPIRGEATPHYTMFPTLPDVSGRIRSLVPDARLIYIVRDPIDRLVSHYTDQVKLTIEKRPFEEIVVAASDDANIYVSASRYATQLECYLEQFPESQLLVLDQHDLRMHRRDTLRRVFDFLGVDPDFWSSNFEDEHNTTARKQAMTTLGIAALKRGWIAKSQRLPARIRSPLGRLVKPALFRELPPPHVTPALRARLVAELADEATRFRTLTGQSFATWSV